MRYIYPQGKKKALTFSYDDGQAYDKKLLEIFNTHGLRGTFHLNSGTLDGKTAEGEDFMKAEEVKAFYAGHEVACHGVQHKNLPTIPRQQMMVEIAEDRKALEQITGGMVFGMSYAFGNYNATAKEVLKSVGIKYSRTVAATRGFYPPADFLEWHPTCHHDGNLLELGDKFLDVPGYIELPLMYVWGHSFEFGRSKDWSVMEAFAEKMCGKDDIWYATNVEICDYIQATRSLEFSADSKTVHNPTAISVWMELSADKTIVLAPGETVYLG